MLSELVPEKALARLKVLEESNDGFEIAEKDLEMRGHGELTGLRQAGAGELDFKEMIREPELLMAAKREAERLIELDPELSARENRILRETIKQVQHNSLDFQLNL
jgi:ATP-dependent DNA helicase RecG